MAKTIAYLRVSTDQQDLNNQKHEIESYAKKRRMQIDEWVEVEVSSRKNMHERRIAELIQGQLEKDSENLITGVAKIEEAQSDEITFLKRFHLNAARI